MAKTSRTRTGNLREDCVTEALSIIAHDGLDKLSLREVARRLGVSHQAPYKHYPSRDHLLATVLKGAYKDFADYLESTQNKNSDAFDLRKMGKAYIRYALSHPLEYRLMFNTSLPDPSHHPEMMQYAHHAFDMLRQALKYRSKMQDGRSTNKRNIDHQALFVWSTLHGVVSIMRSDVTPGLKIAMTEATASEVLSLIGKAIDTGAQKG